MKWNRIRKNNLTIRDFINYINKVYYEFKRDILKIEK